MQQIKVYLTQTPVPGSVSKLPGCTAKDLVCDLRANVGDGAGILTDPEGVYVFPDPERRLAAGEYTFQWLPEVIMSTRSFDEASLEEAISTSEYYLHLMMDGHVAKPVELPDGTAESEPVFHPSITDEKAASERLAESHRAQLQRMGANMGADGYQVLDVRGLKDMFKLCTDEAWYTGSGFDCVVASRAVPTEALARHIRVGFVHHWSEEVQQRHAAAQPSQGSSIAPSSTPPASGPYPQGGSAARSSKLKASHPRVIMALLAALDMQEHREPLDAVATDGETFDLFRFDGVGTVHIYRALSMTEACYALSEALKQGTAVGSAHALSPEPAVTSGSLKQDAAVDSAQGGASQKPPLAAPPAKRPKLQS